MSLALVTHGYVCPPPVQIPPDVEIGPGPDIIDVDDLVPLIDRIHVEDDDPCP